MRHPERLDLSGDGLDRGLLLGSSVLPVRRATPAWVKRNRLMRRMRHVEATLRAARPEDASRISVLLEQLGWAVTPDKVVAELSASPTTEIVVAESDGDVVGLIAVTTRRQFPAGGEPHHY